MNDIINELQSKIKSRIFLDFDMGNSTWFRVGGKAKGYVVVNSVKDLKIILSYSNQDKLLYSWSRFKYFS